MEDTITVQLPDGRVASCWEAAKQEYANCKISAGHVEGIPPDSMYFRFQREEEEPTYFFLRPDEMSALLYVCSGALWSYHIERLEG